MWPSRRLIDLLKIEHPIIQAPMAGSATPELAAAVSDAGGLGSLGCAGMMDDELVAAVKKLRALTNRQFNLNFFANPQPAVNETVISNTRARLRRYYEELAIDLPDMTAISGGPGFDERKLKLLLALEPPIVSFHFGLPEQPIVDALKNRGIVILSSATNVLEARELVRSGADAVIAQGWEAGGHRGSHRPPASGEGIGLIALVPQIVDAVSVPVIAAGGMADGRGIAAALALGADGVQIGTAFLSCKEAGTDERRREFIRTAVDTDTVVTNVFSGRAARTRRSRFTEDMSRSVEELPDFPLMYALSDPLGAAANTAGVDDFGFHIYGQAAALNRELPAGDLMKLLVAETERTSNFLRR